MRKESDPGRKEGPEPLPRVYGWVMPTTGIVISTVVTGS
jgi:hypothetical protein